MEPCAVSMMTAILSARLAEAGEQLHAVHAGHLQIGDDDAGLPGGDLLQRFEAVASGFGAIAPAGDQLGEARQRVGLVFDDQDFFLACSCTGGQFGGHGLLYHY